MVFRRFAALCLALLMAFSLLPAVHAETGEAAKGDIWAQIDAFENAELAKKSTRDKQDPTAEEFAAMSEAVEALVISFGDCLPGSVIRHGSFFYWTTLEGEVCGYSPQLRARMHASSVNREVDPEASSDVTSTSATCRGGSPDSAKVAVFQPYFGLDSNFTDKYLEEGSAIAEAIGGTSTSYRTNAATVDQIADALENCAVVIFDSHGDTDYYSLNSYVEDFVTKANTSYLCLQTNEGWTTEDQQPAEGTYGTYYHAYNAGKSGDMNYYCVDGTVLANHMEQSGCSNFLWMAICLGMATDGIFKPLREKGVEAVYGYSQPITFAGDFEYEEYFWNSMREGHTIGEAFAYMKEQTGADWDPLYKFYDLIRARYRCASFPNLVSSEDEYQGHRTVNPKSATDSSAGEPYDPDYGADSIQTPHSSWTLYPQYGIEALSNNETWGTVSVSGNTVFAHPNVGYYAAGYEFLSGTAEVIQNGDAFALRAKGPCTVQINFAPKDPATVRFVVPDGVSCEDIATYMDDEIILPAPAGTPTANMHPYEFFGWTEQPVADTETQPGCLEAGSTWTVDAPTKVFYALYTYKATDSETAGCFFRIDEKPEVWDGEYVVTYNGEVVLDASGQYTGAQLGSKAAAIPLDQTGMSLEDGKLSGVTDKYVYVIEESQSFAGKHSFRMKGSNNYISLSVSNYTMGTSSDVGYFSVWYLSCSEGAVNVMQVIASQYCLQYNTSGKTFGCYKDNQKDLTLFYRSPDPVFFTTELQSCAHNYVAVVTEPTCTEGGFTTWTCSKCGKSYVADETAALGHTPGEPVKENDFAPACELAGGYDTVVYCTVCDAELSREHTDVAAPGHDWGEPTYTWSEDNSAVTATRTCRNDAAHVETETVNTSSEVTKEASYDEEGEITYTAVFENPAFETQTRAVATPKLEKPVLNNPFEDVKDGAYYYDAVLWAVNAEPQVTAGTSAKTFSPNAICTRAQVVTFLWRASGQPEPTKTENPFRDVNEGAYYYKAVLWAVENGITNGTSATTFGPDNYCTRAQVVTFLWRTEGKPEPTSPDNPFTDVTDGYYFTAVLWAVEQKVTAGTSATAFSPNKKCTRGEIVTFLYRALAG